jgi:murein DD-endopeptidase MepM/ murein hydrolase activator NlpD
MALGILCFITLTFALAETPQLEIRFAPGDHVFLAQDNRSMGVANFEIQNMAVVNLSDQTIKINEIAVQIFTQDSLVKTNYYSGDLLEKNWQMLRSYITLPGMMKEEDPRFRFKELLGDQLTLSESTTLPPKTAFLLSRQFYFVQAVAEFAEGKLVRATWPDRIRVSVKGTQGNQAVSAQNEMQIVNYQPVNKYIFPVSGRWYVGSSSSVRSHHRLLPTHEFALDVIQIGADGKSYRGEGQNYSDYYAYGKEVYAMSDGEVVQIHDGVPETRLKRVDETEKEYRLAVMAPLAEKGYIATGGNQIVIKHAGDEYSSYAHLRSGSIRVKKGDVVKQGQWIANLGLSGDGYQPHLHFQITDGPDLSYSRGIPMIFQNVKPVIFSSTIDIQGQRQIQTGEFIDTITGQVANMNLDQLRNFAKRYTAAWCSQNAASVASFYAENGSLKINDGTPSVGRKDITSAAQDFMTAFPDMVVTMNEVSINGDRAIYRWTLTGTNTGPGGTGNPVHISGSEEWIMNSEGFIASSKGHFDEAEYERQLNAPRK